MVADRWPHNPSGLFAFWLRPSDLHEKDLTARIERLAAEHAAPTFEPHVSLYVARLDPDESPDAILENLSETSSPVECVAESTMHSSELFKALFVPLTGNVLSALHESTRASCRHRAGAFDFAPHMSLMYKVLPASDRATLAATECLAGQRILFDRVAAVCPASGATDFSDIRGWRRISSRKLVGTR